MIESDHKPLIPLLSSKSLDHLPPRIIRFRLRMDKFNYTIHHVAGKELYTADTLSRAPLAESESQNLSDEAEMYIEAVTQALPASTGRLDKYRQAQSQDETCREVMEYCKVGWPLRHLVEGLINSYWKVRGSLTTHNKLLLFNHRIVIPQSERKETLRKIHQGHQGIERCRMRVRESVSWPGVSNQIEQLIKQCPECIKASRMQREPLKVTQLPDYPWHTAGSDLFELNGEQYLIVVDYYSRYPEVVKLKSTTSSAVILALKAVFSRHGLPEILRTDNGPQYSSHEFTEFASRYSFRYSFRQQPQIPSKQWTS